MTGESVSLAQIVAALSVTYTEDKGVAMWLRGEHRTGLLIGHRPIDLVAAGEAWKVAEAVAALGDADPSDFSVELTKGGSE